MPKKVLGLLQWICNKLGLKEQRNKLHRAQFPNHQAILEKAKKNAAFSLPAGGIQLLDPVYEPETKRYDHPKGLFFIDGVPINQPSSDSDILRGMNVWINSEEFNKNSEGAEIVTGDKLYQMTLSRNDIKGSLTQLVGHLSPEQAMPLLKQELAVEETKQKLKFPGTHPRTRYLFALAKIASKKPELMTINPKWFVDSSSDEKDKNEYLEELANNGQDRLDNIFQSSKNQRLDANYLKSLGYIEVNSALEDFKVLRTKQLINKLVAQGEIPIKREDRKIISNPT